MNQIPGLASCYRCSHTCVCACLGSLQLPCGLQNERKMGKVQTEVTQDADASKAYSHIHEHVILSEAVIPRLQYLTYATPRSGAGSAYTRGWRLLTATAV